MSSLLTGLVFTCLLGAVIYAATAPPTTKPTTKPGTPTRKIIYIHTTKPTKKPENKVTPKMATKPPPPTTTTAKTTTKTTTTRPTTTTTKATTTSTTTSTPPPTTEEQLVQLATRRLTPLEQANIQACVPDGDDNALGECIKKVVVGLAEQMKNPELSKVYLGQTSLDRIEVPPMNVNRDAGVISMSAKLDNMVLQGTGDYEISNVTTNVNGNNVDINMSVKMPKATMTSNYDMNAKFLFTPLNGNGKVEAGLTNMVNQVTIKGEFVPENGKQIFKVTSVKANFIPDKVSVKFHDMFNGNQWLTDQANNIINSNMKLFLDLGKQESDEAMGKVIYSVITKIAENVQKPISVN